MSPKFRARVRWLVFLIAFIPILACNPLSLVQQETSTAPTAQALATRAPEVTTVLPTTAATTSAGPTPAPASTSTVAPTVAPTTAPTEAAKFPLIAFVSDRDGAPELYTMKPDGTAQTRLTNTQGKDTLPVWSPDGAKIAFISERSGTPGLYLMNADGSNATLVFQDSLRLGEAPAWSPDGKRIAVVNYEKNLSQIFVVKTDGSGKTRVTDGKANEFSPAWSPDGAKIAFHSSRDKNAQGYTVNADGSGLKRMTLDPTKPWLHPAYSPDGKKIALVNTGVNSRIYVMNVDGSALTALTPLSDSDGTLTRLAWSPDGKQIIFNRAEMGRDQIFVMNVDGKSAPVALTSAGKNYFPTWCCSTSAVTQPGATKATSVAVQPTSTPAGKATTSASSSASGPEAMVKKALEATLTKSYRGAVKGTQSSATFEFSPPNNFHILLGGSDVILIGESEAYMKSDGKWSKTEPSQAGFLLLPIVIGSGYADKMTNVKQLPNETLNGAAMQVVSYTGQYMLGGTPDSLTTPMQYKMWIGADGLPRQVTFQETGQAVGTTTFQYDPSIKVTAPAVP